MISKIQPYVVQAYNTAKFGVQVHRPGLDVLFENRLHDDDVAQMFGFDAGLVPGVDLYAYVAHAPVEHWGRTFLERGTMSCKFLKPVHDGELVSVTAVETSGGLDLTGRVRGEICAVGRASLSEACSSLPSWEALTAVAPRPYKLPAGEDSLRVGDWLGCHTFETPPDWAADFLRDMREADKLYASEKIIHPGQIVRMLNWAVIDNALLMPWLYVGSTVHHLDLAAVGMPLSVRALITGNHERKGHRLLELEGVVLSGGRPVACGTHTVIYQPRQAMEAFRGNQTALAAKGLRQNPTYC